MKINENKIMKNRERALLDYFFKRKNKFAILFLVVAVVALGGAIAFRSSLILLLVLASIGILAFILSLLSALGVFSSQINERELEEIIKADRNLAYEDIFKNLAVSDLKEDYIAEPIECTTPEAYPGRKTIVYRYSKKNNRVYYSQTGYTWILFGKSTLFHYHVSVNHIHGYIGHEVADEICYKDIINIRTSVVVEDCIERLFLDLILSNGDTVRFCLRNRPCKLGSTSRISDKEAELLKLIRKTVRDHR